MKTLFAQLDEIYNELDKYFYDDLIDYEKGIKDILNMLDVRMTGNNENEIYNYIMNEINKNHDFGYRYYYQIDYIDRSGLANYIETFDKDERDKAIETTNTLNHANRCINKDTYYVLDYYRYKVDTNGNAIDDSDELLNHIVLEDK